MQKEHGQVTGIIWKTPEEMAAYQELQQYAKDHSMTVSAAAKQLLMQKSAPSCQLTDRYDLIFFAKRTCRIKKMRLL